MNEINVTPYHKVFEKLKKNSKFDKKIQIYSLYNFNPLVLENFTQFFLSKKKINVRFIKSDYDQIDQEIINQNSGLYKFNPEIIIIHETLISFKNRFYNYKGKLNDDTLKVVYLLGADQIKIKPINNQLLLSSCQQLQQSIYCLHSKIQLNNNNNPLLKIIMNNNTKLKSLSLAQATKSQLEQDKT